MAGNRQFDNVVGRVCRRSWTVALAAIVFSAVAVQMAEAQSVSGTGRPRSSAPLVKVRQVIEGGHANCQHAACGSQNMGGILCAMYAPGFVLKNNVSDTPLPAAILADYVVANPNWKWPQPGGVGSTVTVTYSYSNLLDGGLSGISTANLQTATQQALQVWANYAPLNFVLVNDSGRPEIDDEFYPAAGTPNLRFGHHYMDGFSGVLAHAYYPFSVTGDGRSGDVHFDNGDTWGITPGSGRFDYLEVCVHEIGHALGLEHQSPPPQAIMNPFYGSRYSGLGTAFLFSDDQNGIQAIYGGGGGGCDCALTCLLAESQRLLQGLVPQLGLPAPLEKLLVSVRSFRDGVLMATPEGRQLANVYYTHGCELAQILMTSPALVRETQQLVQDLQPAMAAADLTGSALVSHANWNRGLKFIDTISEQASPELKTELASLRKFLQDRADVGAESVTLRLKSLDDVATPIASTSTTASFSAAGPVVLPSSQAAGTFWSHLGWLISGSCSVLFVGVLLRRQRRAA